MPLAIEPQDRLCDIDGQQFLLLRRGAKNSRINRCDLQKRVRVGESFLIQTSRIQNITSADALWLNDEVAKSPLKPTQTIRIDADVAAELQTLASRHGESVNDALVRLLRLARDVGRTNE